MDDFKPHIKALDVGFKKRTIKSWMNKLQYKIGEESWREVTLEDREQQGQFGGSR